MCEACWEVEVADLGKHSMDHLEWQLGYGTLGSSRRFGLGQGKSNKIKKKNALKNRPMQQDQHHALAPCSPLQA